jgi:hypothetical protein
MIERRGRHAPYLKICFRGFKGARSAPLFYFMQEGLRFWIQQKDVRNFLCGYLKSMDLFLFKFFKCNHICLSDNDWTQIYLFLIANGHLKLLQWSHSQKPLNEISIYYDICNYATSYGHFEILKWARSLEPPSPWDSLTCYFAAGRGDLKMLQWLRTHGCEINVSNCDESAIHRGQLEVLQWLHPLGPPTTWTSSACSSIARYGHLEILKWARSGETPTPWDKWTCINAAMNGHLEILKWARSMEAPWDLILVCMYAEKNGHLEVLKWARERERGADTPL